MVLQDRLLITVVKQGDRPVVTYLPENHGFIGMAPNVCHEIMAIILHAEHDLEALPSVQLPGLQRDDTVRDIDPIQEGQGVS